MTTVFAFLIGFVLGCLLGAIFTVVLYYQQLRRDTKRRNCHRCGSGKQKEGDHEGCHCDRHAGTV